MSANAVPRRARAHPPMKSGSADIKHARSGGCASPGVASPASHGVSCAALLACAGRCALVLFRKEERSSVRKNALKMAHAPRVCCDAFARVCVSKNTRQNDPHFSGENAEKFKSGRKPAKRVPRPHPAPITLAQSAPPTFRKNAAKMIFW